MRALTSLTVYIYTWIYLTKQMATKMIWHENAILVISLILYISPKAGEIYPARTFYKQINKSVKQLNEKLIQYASERKIDYIDLNSVVSKNDVLQDEYTTDGVHLTPEGYQKWTELINSILIKTGI